MEKQVHGSFIDNTVSISEISVLLNKNINLLLLHVL